MDIDPELLNQAIDLYKKNVSLRQIQERLGVNRRKLSSVLTELGIKTTVGNHYRKYFFDENYFHTIDTQDKAYWLGFFYADGCVLPLNKDGYGEQAFKLALAEKDRKALEDLKEDMHSTYPIRYDFSRHRKIATHQVQVLLEQRSQKTVNDLKDKGCVESKSLILEFPTEEQVPRALIYHFIRGYMDGDGSISLSQKGKHLYCTFDFVGTENFIKSLSTFFSCGHVIKDKRKKNSWYFRISDRAGCLTAGSLIYQNAHRYLERKHDRFQQFATKYGESQGS